MRSYIGPIGPKRGAAKWLQRGLRGAFPGFSKAFEVYISAVLCGGRGPS